ncbi:MAG: FdhF/YdeP family oxidoreductase, partial [Bacteroidia bacterium]
LSSLEEAKKQGVKVISVNPLKEPGLIKFKNPQGLSLLKSTAISDHYLQVKINGDHALLKAILYSLNRREEKAPGAVFDLDFIKTHTTGYKELIESIKQEEFDDLVKQSGVSKDEIELVADLLAKNEKIIICWAMGLTQHKNGVATIQEIVNLLLLKGSIGKPGAGTCPVRGHSNVQGDRTMGIYEKPKADFLDKLEEVFERKMPREHGWDVVEAIHAMGQGNGKVFFAMGGNFLSATPDTLATAKALENCELTVQVSTKPNRSHLIHGKRALILPCLGRSEEDAQASGNQFVTVENSMGVVHQSQGDRKPASNHLKSEARIVSELAAKVFNNEETIDWLSLSDNYDNLRDIVAQVIPGFENYNQRVRQKGGFYLPNGPRENDFWTEDKKAHLTVNQLNQISVSEDQYVLMTIRSHDQFNTTVYGLDDRYRGVFNERRVLFMNMDDMKKEGLEKGSVVNLTSHFNGFERHAYRFIAIPYDIPKGCTGAYFPETNVLVPLDSTADESNTPTSKSIVITIE